MSKDGLKTAQAEQVLGLPTATLYRMLNRGFHGPELRDRRWSRRQIVALAIMRAVRRQGACLTASVAAYDLLCKKSAEDLAADLASGRRYLVLLGESMILRLVDRGRAFDPELRDRAIRESLPLVIADVAIVSEVIDAAIANLGADEKQSWENFPSHAPGANVVAQRGRQTAL